MNPKRLPLAIAFLLTPDGRPRTRMAIMRAAVLQERSGFAPIPLVRRKRLLRGMGGGQRVWVSVGVSLYGIARNRPFVLPLFAVALMYFAYRAAALVASAI